MQFPSTSLCQPTIQLIINLISSLLTTLLLLAIMLCLQHNLAFLIWILFPLIVLDADMKSEALS